MTDVIIPSGEPLPDVQPPRRGRGFVKFIAFLAVMAMLLGGVGLYLVSQARGTATGAPATITIQPGSTAGSIADNLSKHGVIRSPWLFKLLARMRGTANELKPGEYQMRVGMSFNNVFSLLEKGPAVTFVRITIPEGRTIGQIATIVASKFKISEAAFLTAVRSGAHRLALLPKGSTNLEGLLFPDTYFVKDTSTADDIVQRMLDEFAVKAGPLDFSKAKAAGLSEYQSVILASLVEREAKVGPDRALIASVMYNRLKRGMQLQIDATVQYAIYLKTGKIKTEITYEDLEIESPYNTYKIAALPPAPIAAPGLASLQAAVAPATTNFLYYVLSTDGRKHCFAATFQEFNAYKNRTKSCA